MNMTDTKQPHDRSKHDVAFYVVATPIGNLGDMTYRAVEVLSDVDYVVCEDTRVTTRLLMHYRIKTPLQLYHDHSDKKARKKLISMLESGKSLALVSDAGTPLISDPGYKLVREVREAGFPIIPIAGACAAIAGLSVSGLPTNTFLFLGFLPLKNKARSDILQEYKQFKGTIVFYETARKLVSLLKDIRDVFEGRSVCVAREISKFYEDIRTEPVSALIKHYTDYPPKGEVVVVVEGCQQVATVSEKEMDTLLHKALTQYSIKDAVDMVSNAYGLPKKKVYARALELKNEDS